MAAWLRHWQIVVFVTSAGSGKPTLARNIGNAIG
jgi:hypothetical protein